MNVCLMLNVPALYMTCGALVGAPIGYALGWMTDPAGMVAQMTRVLLAIWDMERDVVAYTFYLEERTA